MDRHHIMDWQCHVMDWQLHVMDWQHVSITQWIDHIIKLHLFTCSNIIYWYIWHSIHQWLGCKTAVINFAHWAVNYRLWDCFWRPSCTCTCTNVHVHVQRLITLNWIISPWWADTEFFGGGENFKPIIFFNVTTDK